MQVVSLAGCIPVAEVDFDQFIRKIKSDAILHASDRSYLFVLILDTRDSITLYS